MAKPGRVFVFFNCDENKTEASMNIFYNHTVYKDTKTSRKALWKKVKEEHLAERIQISSDDYSEVEKRIIDGDPSAANPLIKFGAIQTFDCF